MKLDFSATRPANNLLYSRHNDRPLVHLFLVYMRNIARIGQRHTLTNSAQQEQNK